MSWNTDRAIIGALEYRSPQTVAELATALQLAEPTIRRHLRQLAAAGSVCEGGPGSYSTAPPAGGPVAEVEMWHHGWGDSSPS